MRFYAHVNEGTLQLCKLLFSLLQVPGAADSGAAELAVGELQRLTTAVSVRYASLTGERSSAVTRSSSAKGRAANDREVVREISSYTPLVLHLLASIKAQDDATLTQWLPWLYPALVRLASAHDSGVSSAVTALLLARVPPLLGLTLAGGRPPAAP